MMKRVLLIAMISGWLMACTGDPIYIQPPVGLEVGRGDDAGNLITAQLTIPVEAETPADAEQRAELTEEVGEFVSHVRLEDMAVSVEWTIKNLSGENGQAVITINGANERFAYVPAAFVFDPEEDEEPPPLLGGVPISVPAQSTVSGVFREDEVREAAIDLELITRSGLNPFEALLVSHEELAEITGEMGGVIPIDLVSGLVRFDVSLAADEHMVLEYAIRVRDFRGNIHELLLSAPADELFAFAPMDFAPPPPVEETP